MWGTVQQRSAGLWPWARGHVKTLTWHTQGIQETLDELDPVKWGVCGISPNVMG